MAKQDSHLDAKGSAKTPAKESISGPVTQKHRLKLGEADGMNNPNGVGQPSRESSISNNGGKRW